MESPTRDPVANEIRIELHGDLAGQSVEDLAAQLSALAVTSRPQVRLDLTGVPHISVRAQVLLLAIARMMHLRGGELTLAGPSHAVRAEGMRVGLFGRIRTVDTIDR